MQGIPRTVRRARKQLLLLSDTCNVENCAKLVKLEDDSSEDNQAMPQEPSPAATICWRRDRRCYAIIYPDESGATRTKKDAPAIH